MTAERETLAAALAQTELTDDDRERIKALAAMIRSRLDADPTYEQKRKLLELLGLRVQLHETEQGRALYATCGLAVGGDTLTISLCQRSRSHY